MRRGALGVSREELLADIRAKCLDCCCQSRAAVATCKDTTCRLWRWRMGTARTMSAMDCQTDGQIDMFTLEEAQ